MFDLLGELGGSSPGAAVGEVFEEGGGGVAEFEAAAGFADEVAVDVAEAGGDLVEGEGGFEVDFDGGVWGGAELGAEAVEGGAFEAVAGDDEFADGGLAGAADGDIF